MDLAMPEFTGYDILTDLKRQNLIDKNNIIIFTASSVTDAEIEEMLKMGAKGILRKPVSIDDLTELIEREVQ
jgi:CheY-like chemotaxis protein